MRLTVNTCRILAFCGAVCLVAVQGQPGAPIISDLRFRDDPERFLILEPKLVRSQTVRVGGLEFTLTTSKEWAAPKAGGATLISGFLDIRNTTKNHYRLRVMMEDILVFLKDSAGAKLQGFGWFNEYGHPSGKYNLASKSAISLKLSMGLSHATDDLARSEMFRGPFDPKGKLLFRCQPERGMALMSMVTTGETYQLTVRYDSVPVRNAAVQDETYPDWVGYAELVVPISIAGKEKGERP